MKKKFNIVDVVIILLIVFAVVAGAVYFKSINSKDNNMANDTIKLNFVIEVNNLTENMANAYKEGQKILFNDYGDCEGIIKKVEVLPYKIWTKNTKIGEVLITEIPGKYTAQITVETDAVKTDNEFICKKDRINIGKSIPFKVKGAAAESCYIIDLYEVEWGEKNDTKFKW